MGQGHAVVQIGSASAGPAVVGALALGEQRPRPPVLAGAADAAFTMSTVRMVAEVLAGVRAPRQLEGRALPEVWRGLAVHRGARRRAVRPPAVLRTWQQQPVPGVVEAGAVVVVHGRVHALALRMESLRGRWRCTALETTVQG